ncbi:hypothetical protein [Oligella ureolytica]|uniref:Uncharacterized protein n=1 Tax=Oligella ureolytica TaxID=90244 RepID=A0A7T3EY64_9BURK|nr:hypothetical protein [Oligella ureolytica]QPT40566.1 hypothetical protein I6G29_02950 [Oligella ureolytica]
MKKIIAFPILILALSTFAACESTPRKPRVSAGASHSVPFTVGNGKSAWLTNAVRVYPWSRGNKVRVSTGVRVKPTANTNVGVGVGW